MVTVPALDRLDAAANVLILGCGGGFDVYCGVPIAMRLAEQGKGVVLANLSFTALTMSGAERVLPSLWRIDKQSHLLPYFPERWLSEWLLARNTPMPVYGFERTGPAALAPGLEHILYSHDIDLILLVDGGTDSILFGDEPGLGTVVEDASTIVAADTVAGDAAMLASIGFGIDHFHGVSHHAFLENVATLTRDGAYLGTVSLTPGSPEAEALAALVEHANQRQSTQKSIVLNSILSALNGEFGDYHATDRTLGSELFINPLMTQYWFFTIQDLVRRMAYAEELAKASSWEEARSVVERVAEPLDRRPRRPIPL